ncbi:MAG: flagellar assembly protein FliH [Pseudohongiellaceae bacterium]|jgi:flagellar assembly protein FliH
MTSDPTKTRADGANQNYTSWNLPNVTSTILLSSAEKEARERKDQRFKRQKKTGPVDEAAGESIEVVETADESVQPITADRLRTITDAAEKEGHEVGYGKGVERGYEDGEKKGYNAGLEKAHAKVTERCERIDRIIEALLMPLESERKKLEILMVDMICQLTEAVVMREISSDSSQVVKLVDDALKAIPSGSDKFSLYLNKQDIALVESHLGEQQMDKKFNYYADDKLLPGGCRLETKNSTVSNTVDQRLKKVIDDFIHKRIAASDEQIEDVKKALNESLPSIEAENTVESRLEDEAKSELEHVENNPVRKTMSSSKANSEFKSEFNPELNAELNSEPHTENETYSSTSQQIVGEQDIDALANNPPNIDDEVIVEKAESSSGQEHPQAPKKKTESMSPLESAQQKRDEQLPQDGKPEAHSDSNGDTLKDSGLQGENDVPI